MTNTRIFAIFILVGVFIAGILLYAVPIGGRREADTPTEVLKRIGFLEIRPATQLTGPGTFVAVDGKSESYVMVHPICDMDSTELASLWQSSPSVDTAIGNVLAGEFKLGASLLQDVGLDVGGHAIKEIDVKFENTKVFFLTGEDRIFLENKYLKDNCLQAVKHANSVEKQCVTQPFAELQADVLYRVKFANDIAAGDKAKIFGQVAADVATNGSSGSSDTIAGKGLFIGMKLNTWCIIPNDEQHDGDGKTVQDLPPRKVQYVKR